MTNSNHTCYDIGECSDCGGSCTSGYNYTNWLFDLEDDPREEINLIELYPDVRGGGEREGKKRNWNGLKGNDISMKPT